MKNTIDKRKQQYVILHSIWRRIDSLLAPVLNQIFNPSHTPKALLI